MNFRDYRLPDNNNEKRQEETIEPKAPQLLRSNLNLPQLQIILSEQGYPCEVSNHAGTFICNELYFRALKLQARNTRRRECNLHALAAGKDFCQDGEKKPKTKIRQKKWLRL